MSAKATEPQKNGGAHPLGPTLPGHIVLDHELLARLKPHSSQQEWEKILGRSGILSISPGNDPQGQQLRHIQHQLTHWKTQDTPGKTLTPLQRDLSILAGTVIWFFIGSLLSLPSLLNAGIGISGAIFAYLFFSRPQTSPQISPGHQLYQHLQPLLRQTFITVWGNTILENTPHRTLLQLRMEQLDTAILKLHGQIEASDITLNRILELNQRLGRPIEDIETEKLRASITRQQQAILQVKEVQERLTRALSGLDAMLDHRRALAERLALSHQAGNLMDGPEDRMAAEIEVEALEIEALIQKLPIEELETSQRLLALLEVSTLRPTR